MSNNINNTDLRYELMGKVGLDMSIEIDDTAMSEAFDSIAEWLDLHAPMFGSLAAVGIGGVVNLLRGENKS